MTGTKRPLPHREDWNPEEWGNIQLSGLTDAELHDPYANIRVNNRLRSKDPNWKKIIDSRRQIPQTAQQRRASSHRAKKMHKDPEFRAKMREVYRSEKFLTNTRRANSNPERNQNISEKLSQIVQTPAGTMTVNQAAKLHKITTEGVRYRCRSAKPKWKLWRMKSTNKKMIYVDNSKRQQMDYKRLQAIAEKNGYIHTPLGKFLSVRQAWKAQCKKDSKTQANAHVWFKKMCELKPKNYCRITVKKKPN